MRMVVDVFLLFLGSIKSTILVAITISISLLVAFIQNIRDYWVEFHSSAIQNVYV